MHKIEGLDTLRFFSFFAIFAFHATPYFKVGYLGVDFFFVLSSFLLTFLALREIETSGSFSRINFFARRVLRIFPLYYLIIGFSFFLLPVLGSYFGYDPNLPRNKLLYGLFLSNYEMSDSVYYLKFLWSIAVEEQFYLLFLIMSFLLNRNLIPLVLFLLLCYLVFMIYALNNNVPRYENTFTHFPNFAVGMLAAYWYYRKYHLRLNPVIILLLSITGILLFTHEIFFHIGISVLFAALIFLSIRYSELLSGTAFFKLTEKLGGYTYGMYVYSGLVLTFVSKSTAIDNLFLRVIVEFGIILIVSILSYHFYERYFLKLKKYFRPAS